MKMRADGIIDFCEYLRERHNEICQDDFKIKAPDYYEIMMPFHRSNDKDKRYEEIIEALLEELKAAEYRLQTPKGCSNYEYLKDEFLSLTKEDK